MGKYEVDNDSDDEDEEINFNKNKKPSNNTNKNYKTDSNNAMYTEVSPMAAPTPKNKRYANASAAMILPEEHLDDDFEETPWLPPSIEKAKEYKQNIVYRGGDIPMHSLNIVEAPDLGPGVTLYFQFALSMAVAMFFMTLLSIPTLVFAYNGQRIPEADRDAFGLYRLSMGNIGYDQSSTNYRNLSTCTSVIAQYSNETCIKIGGSIEISLIDAGGIMTACEFLQVIIFLLVMFHLYRKVISIEGKKLDTAISDYSIQVKGIPSNTTEKELLHHFSNLYQLNKPDWRGRPALEDASPVDSFENCGNPVTLNSWVAECTVHKKIGKFISAFKNQQHLMEKLYKYRAKMKMYGESTSHASGHNLVKYTKAENLMIKTGTLIDTLTEQNMKDRGLKMLAANDVDADVEAYGHGHGHKSGGKVHFNIYHRLDAHSVAAFVVFQYSESLARCLEDYSRYSKFPFSLFYPEVLKFKGKRLIVLQAPEPDQIVWENLEVSNWKKFYRRTRTTIISIILVIVCFIIILQASIYKQKFSSSIPDSSLCVSEIPLLFSNTTSGAVSESLLSEYSLTRDNAAADYDKSCSTYHSGSFYAVYSNGISTNPITQSYSLSVCGTDGLCPSKSQKKHCPCVYTEKNKKDSNSCLKADCNPNVESSCYFDKSAIGACYCYSELTTSLSASGVIATLQKISESGPCKIFYNSYSLASGLTYVSVAISVIVNSALRKILIFLTSLESHSSNDKEQGSIMIKIFIANYTIMSIIILVASGRAANLPNILKTLHIFNGPYRDFDSGWYGNIGFYFITTFFINSFSPLLKNLFDYYIGKPFERYTNHSKV
eukprot:gene12379-16606_t